MINVGRVVTSGRFVQAFIIKRKQGSFNNGRWTETAQGSPINKIGIVQPAKQDQLLVLPEGERKDDAILIHCKDEIKVGDSVSSISDIIEWQGNSYRAAFKKPWQLNGYYWVIAVRI